MGIQYDNKIAAVKRPGRQWRNDFTTKLTLRLRSGQAKSAKD